MALCSLAFLKKIVLSWFLLFWVFTLTVECTYCKSLWIKASAKWNVMWKCKDFSGQRSRWPHESGIIKLYWWLEPQGRYSTFLQFYRKAWKRRNHEKRWHLYPACDLSLSNRSWWNTLMMPQTRATCGRPWTPWRYMLHEATTQIITTVFNQTGMCSRQLLYQLHPKMKLHCHLC